MSERVRTVIIHGVLILAAALALLPLAWMLLASFMPSGEATTHLLPSTFTTMQYRTLFTRLNLLRYLGNSVLIASAVTLLSLLFNSLAGYAFAKLRFAGRERIFSILLLALVIPGQVAMLPLFLIVKQLGLINSYWGVMIPGLASIFGIFLVRQYALSIPDNLLHAARMDGAGELRIYWSIVLPICRPVLATLALFTFMGTWNDFLWPLIVLADERRYTLPVALANLLGEHAQDTEIMMAGAVLTVAPVVLVFLALQRQYIAGIVGGAIKE
jgi:multiple sugar transport system permease protein